MGENSKLSSSVTSLSEMPRNTPEIKSHSSWPLVGFSLLYLFFSFSLEVKASFPIRLFAARNLEEAWGDSSFSSPVFEIHYFKLEFASRTQRFLKPEGTQKSLSLTLPTLHRTMKLRLTIFSPSTKFTCI